MRLVLTGGTEPARNAIAAAAGWTGEGEIEEITGDVLREMIRMADASSVEVRIEDVSDVEVVVDNAGPESQAHPDREVEDGIPEQEPALEGEEALAAGEVAVGEAIESHGEEYDADAAAQEEARDEAAEAKAEAAGPGKVEGGESAPGVPPTAEEEAAEAASDPNAPPAQEPADSEKDYEASSEAEELAEAEGIDLNSLEGSGADGRILVSDVRAAIEARG